MAEERLTASLKSRELSVKVWESLRAEALFPLSPAIRSVLAHQVTTAHAMPPLIGLIAIRQALARDPNSALLLGKLVLVRRMYGDHAGARESAEDFARRYPNLPEARQLLELTKGQTP